MVCGERYFNEKPVQPDRFKTRLCDKFILTWGNCPYGTRCMFAHGEEELRTAEENLSCGLVTKGAIRLFQLQYYSNKNRNSSLMYCPSCRASANLFSSCPPAACQSWKNEHQPRGSQIALPPPPAYEESVQEFRHNPYRKFQDNAESSFASSLTSVDENGISDTIYFPKDDFSSLNSCTGCDVEEPKKQINTLLQEVAVM